MKHSAHNLFKAVQPDLCETHVISKLIKAISR